MFYKKNTIFKLQVNVQKNTFLQIMHEFWLYQISFGNCN
jgi:hypothetical protein